MMRSRSRSRSALVGLLAVVGTVASVLAPSPAAAAIPGLKLDEYRVPTPDDAGASKLCLNDMKPGPGGMWYTRVACAYPVDPAVPTSRIGVMAADGTAREAAFAPNMRASFMSGLAGDGNFWVVYSDIRKTRWADYCTGRDSTYIVQWRSDPAPSACGSSTQPGLYGLARVNPSTLAIDYFLMPEMDNSDFWTLTVGPDGNVYWNYRVSVSPWDCSAYGWNPTDGTRGEINQLFVAKLDPRTFPSTRTFQRTLVRTGGVYTVNPQWDSLDFAPDGNLYFGNHGDSLVASPPCTDVRRHNPDGSAKTGGPYSDPMYNDTWTGGQIYRYSPATNSATVIYDSAIHGPRVDPIQPSPAALSIGPDGNIWMAGAGGNHGDWGITRFTTAGAMTAYRLWSGDGFSTGTYSSDMAAGSDGRLWFTTMTLGGGGTRVERFNTATGTLDGSIDPSASSSLGRIEPGSTPDVVWVSARSGHLDVVRPANVPPVVVDDNATTPVGTAVTVPVLSNDSDPDGSLLPATVSVTVAPGAGTTTVNPDGTITYTPGPAPAGTQTFMYRVCDDGTPQACGTATVTVTITGPVNQAPFVRDDTAATGVDVPVVVVVLANDTDPDGAMDPTSVTRMSGPTSGTAVVNADGSMTYTPGPGFSGTDSFRYQACDDAGAARLCGQATVSVTVAPGLVVNGTRLGPA